MVCDTQTVPDIVNVGATPTGLSEITIQNDVPEPKGRKCEYKKEYADIACRLKAAYFTDEDVAYALGCSISTLNSWKKQSASFKSAIDDGRREAKKRLVARAMKQAMGYTFVEKNFKHTIDKDGKVIKSEESEFRKENPGNERLLVFLLCNIDRQLGDDEWKSVSKVEVDESRHVKIVIDSKSAKDQIDKLAGELGE